MANDWTKHLLYFVLLFTFFEVSHAAPPDDPASLFPIYEGWIALGDSYAAGIGAGTRVRDNDAVDQSQCSQYTNAYPRLLKEAIAKRDGRE